MSIIKFTIRIIFKGINNVIDFISYIFNIELKHLPKF
jgi:hypothetical protein